MHEYTKKKTMGLKVCLLRDRLERNVEEIVEGVRWSQDFKLQKPKTKKEPF